MFQRTKSSTRSRINLVLLGIVCVGLVGTLPAQTGNAQSVLYVQADAAGAGDGSSWADAYSDLQEALAVAVPGNDIWVAAGTYLPSATSARDATFQLKSGVGLYGGFVGTELLHSERDPATNLTILSGDLKGNDPAAIASTDLLSESKRSDNSFHVVTGSGADETAVLDGFVITGGNANRSGNTDGGGMINVETVTVSADPTLVNCTFYGNSANRNGGGIYNRLGDPTITDCVFSENHGNGAPIGQGGGGVHNERGSLTLRNCWFGGNTSIGGGAGLYNHNASPTVIDTTFDGNRVVGSGAGNGGGGIRNHSSDATIINCTFTGNSAVYGGGGIGNTGNSSPTVVNCIFTRNEAINRGVGGFGSWTGNPIVINCTFAENSAVSDSGGLGHAGGSRTTVSNCIFWGNTANSDAQIAGSSVVTYSCVQGGISGEGNMDTDPRFADPQNGDYRLKSQGGRWDPLSEGWTQDDVTSPCIDAGDPMSPIGPEPFPNGRIVNMGAYGGTAQASKSSSLAHVPNPSDDGIHEDTWINLSWMAGAFAVSHDVYLGENFDDVNDGFGDTFRGNQVGTSIIAGFVGFAYPDGLVPGTTYYWRIDEVNDADPNSPWRGPVWSFLIPPETAFNPNPIDGAELVDPNTTLSWMAGFGAKLHTVYFGADHDTVANATGGIPTLATTYDPGPVEFAKTYYWRVDEFDGVNTYKGDIWSFTTADFILVDRLQGSSNNLYIGTGKAMAPGADLSGLINDIRIHNRAVKP
jgi:hypothetical protein